MSRCRSLLTPFSRRAGCFPLKMALRLLVGLAAFTAILSLYSFTSRDSNCTDSCPAELNTHDNSQDTQEETKYSPVDASTSDNEGGPTVQLAVVACGERLEETLMMLKSALTFGNSTLHAHIFCDDDLREKFSKSLVEWKKMIKWRTFNYSLYRITFPEGKEEQWRKLFKPCACQRLFIPDLLKSVDSLIYVDTDILFHRSPDSLWKHFSRFNSSQIAGLAPESEDTATNWYVRFARHPFYPPVGVNSGVMLMNLTRMRAFDWSSLLWPLYTQYRYNLTWGDQDIINIIFHDNPEKLYTYECHWNFRPDHCMYSSVCKKAEQLGAFIIHGSRSYFHLEDKQPAFRAVYKAWKKYPLGSNIEDNLLEPMRAELTALKKSLSNGKAANCVKVFHIYTKMLEKFVEKHGGVPGREI